VNGLLVGLVFWNGTGALRMDDQYNQLLLDKIGALTSGRL